MDAPNLIGTYLDLASEPNRKGGCSHWRSAALSFIFETAIRGDERQCRRLATILAPMTLDQATAWIYANADKVEGFAS